MTDQVSWGLYISNFTFLVGVAAAAIMLAIPAYIFDRKDIKDVVLMGDTMAKETRISPTHKPNRAPPAKVMNTAPGSDRAVTRI